MCKHNEAIHNLSNQKIFNGEIKSYRLPRKFFKFSRNDKVESLKKFSIIDCHDILENLS
ncbi:hypothetical protein [Helicobacter sp.]|uniref:hypothetical protein n=1 Tax=Helicobacter sp. TaxID=218 RepID=UPI002A90E655|nr:hypothetical protein [Helicobacter sp.]MDY5556996.1 hypothetical protein [Helicobacter sp.]